MSKIEPEPELGPAGPAPLDLAYLQTEVHALARAKGWYEDRDLSDPDVRESMLALIHSEISEALECVRRGELTAAYESQGPFHQIEGCRQGPPFKPTGLPSELADVVIRVLDYCAAYGVRQDFEPDMIRDATRAALAANPVPNATRLGGALYAVHRDLNAQQFGCTIGQVYVIAAACHIDLDEAIRLKHAYNATRPHRHGNKAL